MPANKTMRVALCLAALACCALMVQARSADLNSRKGRSLLYTCEDAKALSGNCQALCDCVTSAGATVDNCAGLCEECVKATASCPADNSLPDACAKYSGESAVNTCIGGGASGRRMF